MPRPLLLLATMCCVLFCAAAADDLPDFDAKAARDAIEKEEKLAKKLSAQPLGGINPATGLPLGLQQAPYGKWRNNIKLREDVQDVFNDDWMPTPEMLQLPLHKKQKAMYRMEPKMPPSKASIQREDLQDDDDDGREGSGREGQEESEPDFPESFQESDYSNYDDYEDINDQDQQQQQGQQQRYRDEL